MKGKPKEDETAVDETKRERFVNLAAFFVFGFTEYVTFGALLSGAEDILANTTVPTTMTIMTANGPFLFLSIICPYFISKVPVVGRVWLAFVCFVVGLLVVALSKVLWLKMLGIGINSVGYFFVEVGLLPLTAFYSQDTLIAFSGGTGLGLIGTLYYTIVTTFGCVTPRDALLSIIWLPISYPIFYYLMEDKSKIENSKTSTENDESTTKYTLLTPLQSTEDNPEETPEAPLTGQDRLQIAKSLLPYAAAFFLGVTGEYLSMGGLATTLAFPKGTASIGLEPRDHFVYYSSSFAIGELFGRSYGCIALCFKRTPFLVTKHTWIFSLIIWLDVSFLFFASWYRFLNSVWIVMFVAFTVGLAAGALYCNAFSLAGKSDESARRREFSRAFLVGAFAGGLVVGSLLGAVTEPLMRSHCMQITDGHYCITRKTGQWNSTSCWLKKQ